MQISAEYCSSVFHEVIKTYHLTDDVDTLYPFEGGQSDIHHMLMRKCWIDCVQWHLEDIIRRPDLPAPRFIEIKRRIDRSNQERTDLVEKIDDWFLNELKSVSVNKDARINTETPAWALDRLSILMLKLWHMDEQARRAEAEEHHRAMCSQKYSVLLDQKNDLCASINSLMEELEQGRALMKVYRQMKMYNDPSTNPELYKSKS